MEEFKKKGQEKNKISQLQTFPVPFFINEINKNFSTGTNKKIKQSNKELIDNAIHLHQQGNLQKASKYYQYCINNGINDHRVFSNYGAILKDLGKLQEAEIFTRKAIKINPKSAIAFNNLGNIFIDQGNLQKAELYTRKAIKINPDYVKAYSNLGNILRSLGQLKESEASLQKAIELNPNSAEANYNLSCLELLKEDYQSGLEKYEFRLNQRKPTIPHKEILIRKVDNEILQKGEKLLVVSEQGLGDTLQYMRYVPYLRKKGLDVSFCAQKKLHSIIKASGIDPGPMTQEQSILVSEGKWIPLLSLPRYLKVRPNNVIISEPYISSNDELKNKWKNILSKEKRPIVGINWQGNKQLENTYQGRSIPLETFSILCERNKITMLSLQKGFGSEQLNNCSFQNKFVACQEEVNSTWDFLENAAIIENCDLIITCDTSIAHLAGGMGKKVWLLLRDIPFWTWGLKGDSTFWYSSMKLFRQKERHNWDEVMERVSNQLNTEKL